MHHTGGTQHAPATAFAKGLRPRILMRRLHLWLGLSIGLIFVLLGLTGSALVFYQEVDALLHPEIRVSSTSPAPDWSSPVWDRALRTVRHRWPESRGQWRFEVGDYPGPIAVRLYPSGMPGSHMARRVMVWLSPDGTRLLRQQDWGSYAMSWLYELHMDLLSGETGHALVGWSGLAILALLLTGLVAWWPRGGQWRKAIAFKRRAAPLRRLHDLHKLTGLWGLLLLALFAGTGFMLALPDPANRAMAQIIAPVDAPPAPQSVVRATPPISIAMALSVGHRLWPDARIAWIEVPPPGTGVIRLRVQRPGDPSRRFLHSYIHIDQYSGEVLAVQDASRASPSTTINNWLHPLHDASIGGLPTRILAFLVGLMPAALFLTGLLRWRQRSLHKNHKKQGVS